MPTLNLLTFVELGNLNQINLSSQPDQVLFARVRRYWGFDCQTKLEVGFRNGSYPGPITAMQGDETDLLWISTDVFTNPPAASFLVKGFIVGTLSWQVGVPRNQSDEVSESPDGVGNIIGSGVGRFQ
jgi:hypothetical protein